MRIAHVSSTFPPYYAGIGNVCYQNALGLARLGHKVSVFTPVPPNGTFTYPREFSVQHLKPLLRIGNTSLIPGLLRLRGFDIIHLHWPFPLSAEMIWLASKLHGTPYVITHHNDLVGDRLRRYLYQAYSLCVTRLVFGGAKKYIAVSTDHASSCRLTPIFRQRWADVMEVPNGVNTELFRPGLSGSSVRRNHGIPDNARVVLFVGALDRAHHFKSVGHLLRAFSRITVGAVFLIIVGDGDLKEHCMVEAKSLKIADRTRFVGTVPHAELPPYYAAADITVLSSFPPESFGMVLIESLACGKPVVASNLPGVRSVVDDGQNGLLVTPGDVKDLAEKIQSLLKDDAHRQGMGAQGRAKVEQKYAWPKIIPRLVEVYEEVLANGNVRG